MLEKESNELGYSLENEFKLYKNAHSLPVPFHSAFCATFGIVGVCHEELLLSKSISVMKSNCLEGEMIVLLPNQTISVKDKSDNFKIDYFLLSQTITDDILGGISRFSPLFFIYMRQANLTN